MGTVTLVLQFAMNHPIEAIGFVAFVTWLCHSVARPDLG